MRRRIAPYGLLKRGAYSTAMGILILKSIPVKIETAHRIGIVKFDPQRQIPPDTCGSKI